MPKAGPVWSDCGPGRALAPVLPLNFAAMLPAMNSPRLPLRPVSGPPADPPPALLVALAPVLAALGPAASRLATRRPGCACPLPAELRALAEALAELHRQAPLGDVRARLSLACREHLGKPAGLAFAHALLAWSRAARSLAALEAVAPGWAPGELLAALRFELKDAAGKRDTAAGGLLC